MEEKKPIPIARRKLVIVLLIAIVALVSVGYWMPLVSPRMGRLFKAQDFTSRVQPKIEADPRFSSVTLFPFTGGGLHINGEVKSEDDLLALHNIIEGEKPGVPVQWFVEVIEPK